MPSIQGLLRHGREPAPTRPLQHRDVCHVPSGARLPQPQLELLHLLLELRDPRTVFHDDAAVNELDRRAVGRRHHVPRRLAHALLH